MICGSNSQLSKCGPASGPGGLPYLLYEDAGAAMDWLIRVFGFTERARDRRATGRRTPAPRSRKARYERWSAGIRAAKDTAGKDES